MMLLENIPGSGATSLGAIFDGAARYSAVGSSREGAISVICVSRQEVLDLKSKMTDVAGRWL